jgi:hypothetical protein
MPVTIGIQRGRMPCAPTKTLGGATSDDDS